MSSGPAAIPNGYDRYGARSKAVALRSFQVCTPIDLGLDSRAFTGVWNKKKILVGPCAIGDSGKCKGMQPIFEATGSAGAPALLLIHGSVVTHKMWLPQLQGLSDSFRVIAPDLPGHGALAHAPFSFAAAVQTLEEVLRQEAQGRALVAGLSLGGYIAIELAARHPDRVAGLVLSGCSLNFTGALGLYLKLVSRVMQRGWLRQSRAQAEARTRRMFPAALAEVAEAQLKAGVYPEPLGASFAEMAGKDFTIPLARYRGPGLILNGERDSPARRGEAKFLAAMHQGQAQVLAGAGHACNLDQPESYNQAVRAFGRATGWTVAQAG